MTKTLTPPTRPPRVSVPVSSEVLDTFERLAAAGNMSTGKAIASWLEDTLDAAEYLASKMVQARAAPKLVAAELHAYALGLADETNQLMKDLQAKGRADRAQSSSAAPTRARAARPDPPSSNTGGKVPRVNPNPRGLKS